MCAISKQCPCCVFRDGARRCAYSSILVNSRLSWLWKTMEDRKIISCAVWRLIGKDLPLYTRPSLRIGWSTGRPKGRILMSAACHAYSLLISHPLPTIFHGSNGNTWGFIAIEPSRDLRFPACLQCAPLHVARQCLPASEANNLCLGSFECSAYIRQPRIYGIGIHLMVGTTLRGFTGCLEPAPKERCQMAAWKILSRCLLL